jgi:hypothetical protein
MGRLLDLAARALEGTKDPDSCAPISEPQRARATVPPLTEAERIRLLALAGRWRMPQEEVVVMCMQCEQGNVLADGTMIEPAEARAFLFAEADRIH